MSFAAEAERAGHSARRAGALSNVVQIGLPLRPNGGCCGLHFDIRSVAGENLKKGSCCCCCCKKSKIPVSNAGVSVEGYWGSRAVRSSPSGSLCLRPLFRPATDLTFLCAMLCLGHKCFLKYQRENSKQAQYNRAGN